MKKMRQSIKVIRINLKLQKNVLKRAIFQLILTFKNNIQKTC